MNKTDGHLFPLWPGGHFQALGEKGLLELSLYRVVLVPMGQHATWGGGTWTLTACPQGQPRAGEEQGMQKVCL